MDFEATYIPEKTIMKFCYEIMPVSSIITKKEIISKYKDNEYVCQFLQFLLDKLIVTGISTKKLSRIVNPVDAPFCETILSLASYLSKNNTGSDKDIFVAQEYLDYLSEDIDKNLMKKIITKSLKLGIDTKIVNTVIPGLIKVHEVQQAVALQNAKIKPGEWICLSQKLNGNRATYIDGQLLSRQGKEFSNLQHIKDELSELNSLFEQDMVFDGEIIRKNIDNVSDNENFRIGTGVLNSDDEDKTCLSFVIFDVLPLAEFVEGQSKDTYMTRLNTMLTVAEWLNSGRLNSCHLDVVDFLYHGTDHSMIDKCLAKMDSEGKEGCMLARDVPYQCKRHNGLLKVKTFYTMDLPIVGFENGTGKNEHTLGNIIVKYKDNTVGVGSGFSDEQRDWFWNHRDELLGRIVEVKYKDITKDKGTGKESLQFPTFVQLREVGKEVSVD